MVDSTSAPVEQRTDQPLLLDESTIQTSRDVDETIPMSTEKLVNERCRYHSHQPT